MDFSTMLTADSMKEFREWRESQPLWQQYINSKAIPFSFYLGFSTLSVLPSVHTYITDQELNKESVKGFLFGMKTGSDIKVDHCFQLENNDDVDAILNENSEKEFIGIYSTGTIPDREDISLLEKVSRKFQTAVFLLKTSKDENQESIRVTYEVVYDRSRKTFQERLFIGQLYNHPNRVIEHNKEASTKKFYFTNVLIHFSRSCRFELNVEDPKKRANYETFDKALEDIFREKGITSQEYNDMLYEDGQKKLNEFKDLALINSGNPAIEEVEEVKPTVSDYSEEIRKVLEDKNIKVYKRDISEYIQNKTDEQKIDFVTVLEEICKAANIETLYNFEFEIDSTAEKSVRCFVKVLNEARGTWWFTAQEARMKAAAFMLDKFLNL